MKTLLITTLLTLALQPALAKNDCRSTDIGSLYSSIQLLSESGAVCHTDEDCTAVGIGKATCGGPAVYVVTSETSEFALAIQTLNSKLIETQQTCFEDSGISGACMITPAPKVGCIEQTCQAL